MSAIETTSALSQEELLRQKKAAHDYVATAVQVLTTRVQFYAEEFEGIHQTVQFLRNFRDQIKKEIEVIEPPKPVEPAKPFEMDLSHVTAEPLKVVE